MSDMTRRFALAFITVMLAACAKEYTYTPPSTDEGRRCVAQCQTTQASCRSNQFQGASSAQQQCESNAAQVQSQCERTAEEKYSQCQSASQADYNSCLKYSSNRASCYQQVCLKESCFKQGCYQSADYGFCDSEFRGCYQNCGGTVGIMK